MRAGGVRLLRFWLEDMLVRRGGEAGAYLFMVVAAEIPAVSRAGEKSGEYTSLVGGHAGGKGGGITWLTGILWHHM